MNQPVDDPLPELRIGVSEVRRRPGNRQHVDRSVQIGEMAISTAAVPPPGEARLDVVMESLSAGVDTTSTDRTLRQVRLRISLERR